MAQSETSPLLIRTPSRRRKIEIDDDPSSRLFYRATPWVCAVLLVYLVASQRPLIPRTLCERGPAARCWVYENDGVHKHEVNQELYHGLLVMLTSLGGFFYLMRNYWHFAGNGRTRELCGENSGDDDAWLDRVLGWFVEKGAACRANCYAVLHCVFQLLNAAVVAAAVYCCDLLLGGRFLALLPDVLDFYWRRRKCYGDEISPFSMIFPRRAWCSTFEFGPDMTTLRESAEETVCSLSSNGVNEKVFLVLWVWFGILLLAWAVQTVWMVAHLVAPFLRERRLESLLFRNSVGMEKKIRDVVARLSFGQWYQLQKVGENVEEDRFHLLVESL